jgi:hypothetical protein
MNHCNLTCESLCWHVIDIPSGSISGVKTSEVL